MQRLIRKSEAKRRLGRFRRRWKDNIKENVTGIVWEEVDWRYLPREEDQ
jgi:hypothetical protein